MRFEGGVAAGWVVEVELAGGCVAVVVHIVGASAEVKPWG